MSRKAQQVILGLLIVQCAARADDEASNRAYVTASRWGAYYAKSIPHESYGTKGVTRVYRVTEDVDVLEYEINRYFPSLHVEGPGFQGPYVVGCGPWPRGDRASAEHLAFAVYKQGKLIKEFSTLDLAGRPDSVAQSVSHYRVIRNKAGIVQKERESRTFYVFRFTTVDGRELEIDLDTGTLTQIGKADK